MAGKRFIAVAALVLGLVSAAHAQSASGSIVGNAVAGDVVDIKGTDTGFHRELKIDEDGKYQVRAVPVGMYDVIVKHADGTQTGSTVTVRVGSSARVK